MSQMSLEAKITLFCGLCCLILLGLLGGEWWYGKEYRQQVMDDIFNPKKAGFEMQAVPTYSFSPLPIDQYKEFVDRPVYFEGRKPIAKMVEPTANSTPVVEAPKAPVSEFGLVLTGIVKTPKGVKALFENPKGTNVAEKNKRLGQGEEFNGWKLVEIQVDKVKIQADAETKELPLLKAKSKIPVMGIGNNINPFAPPNVHMQQPPVPNAPNAPNAPPAPNVNPFNLKH